MRTSTKTLSAKVEWPAVYGKTYTIQFRLRVRFIKNPEALPTTPRTFDLPVWSSWEDLAVSVHLPPGSPASPHHDFTDHTLDPETGEPWTDFVLDPAAQKPVEYRVVLASQGRRYRWFSYLPSTVGADGAKGHGPLPNTTVYAGMFNQYVGVINRYRRARLELPLTLQKTTTIRSSSTALVSLDPNPTERPLYPDTPDCTLTMDACVSVSAPLSFRLDNQTAVLGPCIATIVDPWHDVGANDSFHSTRGSGLGYGVAKGGKYYASLGYSEKIESFRLKPDQPALEALPSALRSHVDTGAFGLLGSLSTSSYQVKITYDPSFPGIYCGGGDRVRRFFADEAARFEEETVNVDTNSCTIMENAQLIPPGLLPGDMNIRSFCSNNFRQSCSTGGSGSSILFIPTFRTLGGGNLFVSITPK